MPRYVVTAADREAYRQGCRLVRNVGERVALFFPTFLRHSKGRWARQPFELAEWQREDVVIPLFGWLRPDGFRRFRRAYISVPKKNGKSTLAAGLGLYLLVADGEMGAEIYSAATDLDQARIVHDEAVRMVEASPELLRVLRVNHSTSVISMSSTLSKYEAIASDAAGSEGFNAHGVICDELHVWTDRAFRGSLRDSGAVREQPLAIDITTAGIYDPTSVGWQEYEHAKKILGGAADLEHFVYVREADSECDICDPAIHRKANPSLGVTIKAAELAVAAAAAQARPTLRADFLRRRLNVWLATVEAFFDMGAWQMCGRDKIDERTLAGRACIGGLDLASVVDVAAWVLLFPPTRRDKRYRLLCRFFVPEATAQKRESEESLPYATWARQGQMILTPGDRIDFGEIRKQILTDLDTYDVREIAADEWNLEMLRQQLFKDRDVEVVPYGQTFKAMSPAVKELQRLIIGLELAHGGQLVLTWMAGNAVAIDDGAGNVRLTRKKSRGKIDGIIALLMALGRILFHRLNAKKDSVYDEGERSEERVDRSREEEGGGSEETPARRDEYAGDRRQEEETSKQEGEQKEAKEAKEVDEGDILPNARPGRSVYEDY